MMGLDFGLGSITQAQLVAVISLAVVLVFLLTANMAVCWLYRRATTEDQRQTRKDQRKKKAKVWVYHVHRSTNASTRNPESASQQILRKIQASHDNLMKTKLNASSNDAQDSERQDSLRREEAQALEELEVTTDLFLHETSCASSRRSSLSTVRGGGGGGGNYSGGADLNSFVGGSDSRGGDILRGSNSTPARTQRDLTRVLAPAFTDLDPYPSRDLDKTLTLRDTVTAAAPAAPRQQELDSASGTNELDSSFTSSWRDLDVASALADLDMASALHDLDLDSALSDTEKVSMSSVTMADFENDDPADLSRKGSGKKKIPLLRRSNRKGRRSSSGHGDWGAHSLPVAEFHNEAFDFTETHAAVERINDVEL